MCFLFYILDTLSLIVFNSIFKMKNIMYKAFQKCCGCKESLRNKYCNRNIRRVTLDNLEKTRIFFKNDTITINDYICNRCRKNVSKNNNNIKSKGSSFNCQSSRSHVSEMKQPEDCDNITDTQVIMLRTALASHKKCLFCNERKRLHVVKPETIMSAYLNHGIIIKIGSRCCDTHLDANRLVQTEAFNQIHTKDKMYSKDLKLVLDSCLQTSQKIQMLLKDSSGIFDKFKDMATLDENLCIKITGWNKVQFNNFSNFITRIRDTCGRTKDQLIAIYRYWLSKGIDQCTLAMLKSNTSQQQVSHYLAQIRVAMNEEIVPLFLGTRNGREFFLNHNTDSVKELHQLEDDVLVVIIDGTYTRLEKSSNNEFQYLSYSMQKNHNLVKPFIICCADGYFIDCYGPFQANLNDAQILKHILKTDENLKQLFTPPEKVMMFLDRGKKILKILKMMFI